MKKLTFWVENEIIIVDKNNKVQNYIDWKIANDLVLEVCASRYPTLVKQWVIKKEFDACQVEITNTGWKKTIDMVKDEICELFYKVSSVIEELWCICSQDVVPDQDYIPTQSNDSLSYSQLMNTLDRLWIAKATNIAWLHLNVWWSIDTIMPLHIAAWTAIMHILKNDTIQDIGMSYERYNKYKQVVSGLKKQIYPMLTNIFDANDNVRNQWYRLLRIKKYNDVLITEFRAPDWWVNPNDLAKKIDNAYDFVMNA